MHDDNDNIFYVVKVNTKDKKGTKRDSLCYRVIMIFFLKIKKVVNISKGIEQKLVKGRFKQS